MPPTTGRKRKIVYNPKPYLVIPEKATGYLFTCKQFGKNENRSAVVEALNIVAESLKPENSASSQDLSQGTPIDKFLKFDFVVLLSTFDLYYCFQVYFSHRFYAHISQRKIFICRFFLVFSCFAVLHFYIEEITFLPPIFIAYEFVEIFELLK